MTHHSVVAAAFGVVIAVIGGVATQFEVDYTNDGRSFADRQERRMITDGVKALLVVTSYLLTEPMTWFIDTGMISMDKLPTMPFLD